MRALEAQRQVDETLEQYKKMTIKELQTKVLPDLRAKQELHDTDFMWKICMFIQKKSGDKKQ